MSHMETSAKLLGVTEIAQRREISREKAFDLMFVTRELPVRFEGRTHGVPEAAVEAYRRAHATRQP
jgi:hypothetical protein